MQSWSKKYKKPKEEVFDSNKIARFGRQILTVSYKLSISLFFKKDTFIGNFSIMLLASKKNATGL